MPENRYSDNHASSSVARTMNNYGGRCNFALAPWLKQFVDSDNPPRPTARAIRELKEQEAYSDSSKRVWIPPAPGDTPARSAAPTSACVTNQTSRLLPFSATRRDPHLGFSLRVPTRDSLGRTCNKFRYFSRYARRSGRFGQDLLSKPHRNRRMSQTLPTTCPPGASRWRQAPRRHATPRRPATGYRSERCTGWDCCSSW